MKFCSCYLFINVLFNNVNIGNDEMVFRVKCYLFVYIEFF